METLLAIDPGVRRSGWALFRGNTLFAGGYTKAADTAGNLVEWARSQVRNMRDVLANFRHRSDMITAVVELPRIYPARRAKGDPNDIRDLTFVTGYLSASFNGIALIEPKNWKGTIPKDIHHDRLLAKYPEIASILKINKIKKTHQEHVIDAIGLGYWYLERNKQQ